MIKSSPFSTIAALSFLLVPTFAGSAAFPTKADTVAAAPETARLFNAYFDAKSRHDVEATMGFFSPQLLTYTDAVLGWPLDSYDSLKSVFAEAMPKWGSGKSYPVRVIGGPNSAIVAFVDTPELFGGEIRLIGAVDFKDGKIIRWVDYWDSTGFPTDIYRAVRTPEAKFPTDFKESGIRNNASPEIGKAAAGYHAAVSSGDFGHLADLLSYDVVYEDEALRTRVVGRDAVTRYLGRIVKSAPFGAGSTLLHVVGGKAGGGFEWRGKEMRGITAIELNSDAKATRITTTYDGRLLSADLRKRLVSLSAEE
ncbi:hypothetical protein JNB88_22560 [Rhizobium cauense]|uniref:hypothetical protein n=1 Tax=Rhizobium cauense TaxID=1166683 RepID=UPI001C6E281E|nr:hypothetical protein [Rhizobium cauense]MBW9116423.1 hypothetical protein [Rhizobium cauense]